MTDEDRIADEALILLIEAADTVLLEVKGKRVVLAPDIQADVVRLMFAGLGEGREAKRKRYNTPPEGAGLK